MFKNRISAKLSARGHRIPRRRYVAVAGALVTLFGAAGTLFTSVSAQAATTYGPYSVVGTGSNGLNERSAPSTSSSVLGNLPNGTTVYLACQTAGSSYDTGGSPATDTIWDQLSSGAYVADYWLTTPAVGTFSPGIPRCGTTTPPPNTGTYGRTVGDNPFPAGQCTWGADNLVHSLMASDPSRYPTGADFIDIWGNADQWASSAVSNGWTVITTPRVDSVVVFQPGVQGAESDGHVALVTAVYSNNTFQIHEMNGPAGAGNYDYRTVQDAAGESFILIPPFS